MVATLNKRKKRHNIPITPMPSSEEVDCKQMEEEKLLQKENSDYEPSDTREAPTYITTQQEQASTENHNLNESMTKKQTNIEKECSLSSFVSTEDTKLTPDEYTAKLQSDIEAGLSSSHKHRHRQVAGESDNA